METESVISGPKVSIIIPVYNVEKYLRKCLDSAVGQTLVNIEIICVDDASIDSSWEIVREYAGRDRRIRMAHSFDKCSSRQNRGLSATRNRGLELAQGEYILFLDSDDWLELEAAESLYNLAHREDLDVLCYDFFAEYETEDLRKKFPLDVCRGFCTEKALSGQDVFWRQELCHGYYSMAQLLLCRRSYLRATKQELCFFEGIEYEDLLFGLEVLIAAPRAASVNWQLYHYMRRERSITTKRYSIDKVKSIFIVLYEQLKFLGSQKLSKEAAAGAGRVFYNIYNWFLVDLYYPHHNEIIKNIDFDLAEHKCAFDFFQQANEPYFCNYESPLHTFDDHELDILKEAEHIIIYGAGGVGRRVAEYISKQGFDEFTFAVTKKNGKNYFMGAPIYEMSELASLREKSLVLLSVMPEKQTEMLLNLDDMGFKNVICMIRK